jgi:hypothetical protein
VAALLQRVPRVAGSELEVNAENNVHGHSHHHESHDHQHGHQTHHVQQQDRRHVDKRHVEVDADADFGEYTDGADFAELQSRKSRGGPGKHLDHLQHEHGQHQQQVNHQHQEKHQHQGNHQGHPENHQGHQADHHHHHEQHEQQQKKEEVNDVNEFLAELPPDAEAAVGEKTLENEKQKEQIAKARLEKNFAAINQADGIEFDASSDNQKKNKNGKDKKNKKNKNKKNNKKKSNKNDGLYHPSPDKYSRNHGREATLEDIHRDIDFEELYNENAEAAKKFDTSFVAGEGNLLLLLWR